MRILSGQLERQLSFSRVNLEFVGPAADLSLGLATFLSLFSVALLKSASEGQERQ